MCLLSPDADDEKVEAGLLPVQGKPGGDETGVGIHNKVLGLDHQLEPAVGRLTPEVGGAEHQDLLAGRQGLLDLRVEPWTGEYRAAV